MPEWISIEDQYPEEGEIVLLTDGHQPALGFLAKVSNRLTQVNTWTDLHDVVTHWQKYPQLPQAE